MLLESQAKQHLHELVDKLQPGQVAAISPLLEVMLEPDEEQLSEGDMKAVAASREYFRQHPEGGVSFEEFAAACGFNMDQILDGRS